jgi:hypothetical protein
MSFKLRKKLRKTKRKERDLLIERREKRQEEEVQPKKNTFKKSLFMMPRLEIELEKS